MELPTTPVQKSRRGKQARRRGLGTEKRVIKYLWPDCPRDEFGSVRDHKELHDKIIFGESALNIARADGIEISAGTLAQAAKIMRDAGQLTDHPLGFIYLVEIKSDAWVKGSKAMFSKMKSALVQARYNRGKCHLDKIPVCAIWLPKHCRDVGDAIVLYEVPDKGRPVLAQGYVFKEILGR